MRDLQLADHRSFITVCHGRYVSHRGAPGPAALCPGRRHGQAPCRARRAACSPARMMPLTRRPGAGSWRSPSLVLGDGRCCDPGRVRRGTAGRGGGRAGAAGPGDVAGLGPLRPARGDPRPRAVPGGVLVAVPCPAASAGIADRESLPLSSIMSVERCPAARGAGRGTARRESWRCQCCQCDFPCHRCSLCAQCVMPWLW
jgi:hypothetical protein